MSGNPWRDEYQSLAGANKRLHEQVGDQLGYIQQLKHEIRQLSKPPAVTAQFRTWGLVAFERRPRQPKPQRERVYCHACSRWERGPKPVKVSRDSFDKDAFFAALVVSLVTFSVLAFAVLFALS